MGIWKNIGLIELFSLLTNLPAFFFRLWSLICHVIAKAAAAMDAYLRNPACSITRLALVHADVDDFEAERFVGAFKINRTVTDLDLTNNKLGAAENLNTVMPDLITGGEVREGASE